MSDKSLTYKWNKKQIIKTNKKIGLPSVADLTKRKPTLNASLSLGRVLLLVEIDVKNGAKTSSKNGTASVTGLLLKLISAFAARGVSGKRLVINSCNNDPQEWPMPTTGRAPYSLAMAGAMSSKRVIISSHVSRWSNDNWYGVATTKNPSSASRSNM